MRVKFDVMKRLSLSPCSRRSFLQTTGSLVASVGALGWRSTSEAADKKDWPIACRDTHLKSTGQPDCWSALKYLTATGVEIETAQNLECPLLYHPTKKYRFGTDDDIKALRDDLAAKEIIPTAFLMHNRLTEQLEKELEWTQKVVHAAQAMHVNAIRIDVVPGAMPITEFLPFAIKACKRLCDIVKDTPVRFGIENHGHVTNDPAFLDKLFDGVGSAHLGLTLDAANFYWYGHPLQDLYGLYEKYASRTIHTHCKSIGYPDDQKNKRRAIGWEYGKYAAPVFLGDIDYAKVAGILRRANYAGDLCLENESLERFPKGQQAGVLKMEIQWLQKVALES